MWNKSIIIVEIHFSNCQSPQLFQYIPIIIQYNHYETTSKDVAPLQRHAPDARHIIFTTNIPL